MDKFRDLTIIILFLDTNGSKVPSHKHSVWICEAF